MMEEPFNNLIVLFMFKKPFRFGDHVFTFESKCKHTGLIGDEKTIKGFNFLTNTLSSE